VLATHESIKCHHEASYPTDCMAETKKTYITVGQGKQLSSLSSKRGHCNNNNDVEECKIKIQHHGLR
jgi:hypothetical protein